MLDGLPNAFLWARQVAGQEQVAPADRAPDTRFSLSLQALAQGFLNDQSATTYADRQEVFMLNRVVD